MKIYDVSRLPSQIVIGHGGENDWLPIPFDCSALLEKHPDGVITLWLTPNGAAEAYPVALEREGNVVTWTPKNSELTASSGRYQLRCQDGDAVGESDTVNYKVKESLAPGAEHPTETPSWAIKVVEDVTEAAGHYPYIGENGNWFVWDYTEDNFVDTGVAAGGSGGSGTVISVNNVEPDANGNVSLSANDVGAGTYSKPAGGIPASDLAAGVISDISGKADTADLADVAFSGDYNDLLNRPDDGYIFADEIPQDADRSAKYVLPDGYIYVYGEHTYHRVYNAATDGLLNKVPGLNQNVNYSDDQPGAFLSAPIPWDSSWTQWEKTPTIIRVSGLDQLVPVKWNNAIQAWYYKSDGSYKKMISQQSIHSLGSPSAGESIDLPCEFNMADNNYYPLEGTGYVRVWLGISADGAITADDVANLVINVPFYDSDVTATEWYNSGERYMSDPQVEQNTEDIAALDTRVTAIEEDSDSGGGITVNTNQVLYAVGDSITRGAVAGGEDYAWPKHVIDINGYDATNSRNLGQNGLGFDTAATSSGDTIKDIVDRTDFSAADIVTVALGANDWKNSNARLANIWSSMEYCFNKIRTDNPYCELFYILPFNMSFMGTFATFYCLSGKGDSNPLCPYAYTLMEYVNMIKDKLMEPTFRAFRINVIDMVECAAINRQNILTALADQVHPTAATQEALGVEIARRIVLADGAQGEDPDYQTAAITDTGGYYTTDTVEGALQEIGAELAGINTLIGSGVIS